MPLFLHHFGTDFIHERESLCRGLMTDVLNRGKAIVGYYGLPYINQHYGWLQMVARAAPDDTGRLVAEHYDSHCAGLYVWDVRVLHECNEGPDCDKLSRQIIVQRPDGGGLALIHVINADVLPSYAPGTMIEIQVVAFPTQISYYQDEDQYAAGIAPDDGGTTILPGTNTLIPLGLLQQEGDIIDRSLTQVHGTILKVLWGEIQLGDSEEKFYPFVDCVVDTPFGKLEILHPMEDIPEDQRQYLREGCVVDATVILSGVVALYGYSHGVSRTPENDLQLFSYTLQGGDPERMKSILSPDVMFTSCPERKIVHGIDACLNAIRQMQAHSPHYKPQIATITAVPAEDPAFPGYPCLLLRPEAADHPAILALMRIGKDDLVNDIFITDDPEYRFVIDPPYWEEDTPSPSSP